MAMVRSHCQAITGKGYALMSSLAHIDAVPATMRRASPLVLFTLCLAVLIAQLDSSVVSPAVKRIGSDLPRRSLRPRRLHPRSGSAARPNADGVRARFRLGIGDGENRRPTRQRQGRADTGQHALPPMPVKARRMPQVSAPGSALRLPSAAPANSWARWSRYGLSAMTHCALEPASARYQ
jgi:hypothetical protein